MPQRTKYRNEYVKEGGFQRAVIDFERARPQNIRYLQEPDTVKDMNTISCFSHNIVHCLGTMSHAFMYVH